MHPKLSDPEALLLELLAIPSVTGQEAQLARFLCEILEEHLEHDVLELQEVSPGRLNVLLVRGTPRITFTSHMDTVPGSNEVRQDAAALYGRGACDAKGQIAAQLAALQRAILGGLRDYACLYVVGEEVDSAGAIAAMRHPALGSRYLLNGEPTDNRFVSRSSGVIECHIRARGSQLHSSVARDQSALHKLVRDLARLLDADGPDLLVNVGMLQGQGVGNMSCAFAEARVCLRPKGELAAAFAVLEAALHDSEFELVGPPIAPFDFHVPKEHRLGSEVVPFCSDAPLFVERFEHVMMFGPGSISVAHSDGEFLSKRQLHAAVATLADLALAL